MYLLEKKLSHLLFFPREYSSYRYCSVGIWFLIKKKWKLGIFHCLMSFINVGAFNDTHFEWHAENS